MLMDAPPPGQRSRFGPFHGSSAAHAIAELAGKVRPLLVITANAADAQRLLVEIPWFDPALKVHLLPDWETLPYDSFSPHQDLVSDGKCPHCATPVAGAFDAFHGQFGRRRIPLAISRR